MPIDGGVAFDFGRTAPEYARYRDIYPRGKRLKNSPGFSAGAVSGKRWAA
jgi:hypothetical protein